MYIDVLSVLSVSAICVQCLQRPGESDTWCWEPKSSGRAARAPVLSFCFETGSCYAALDGLVIQYVDQADL